MIEMTMEQRLIEDARAWASAVDSGTPVDVMRIVDTAEIPDVTELSYQQAGRRHRTGLLAAAAAVLVVGSAVGYTVVHGGAAGVGSASGRLPTSPVTVDLQKAPRTSARDLAEIPMVTTVPRHALSMPWTLIGISADRRTLALRYVVGDGCWEPAGVQVVQTPATVLVMMISTELPGQQACADLLKMGTGTIRLNKPLAERKLLHPPTSRGWPASLLRP